MKTFTISIDEYQAAMIIAALEAHPEPTTVISHDFSTLYDYSPQDIADLFKTLEENVLNGLTI